MIENFSEIVIFNSLPCIIFVCIVLLLLIASRIFQLLSVVLKLFATIVFVFQAVWQIIYGTSFQELLIVWTIEAMMYLLMTRDPDREIIENPKLTDSLIDENGKEIEE